MFEPIHQHLLVKATFKTPPHFEATGKGMLVSIVNSIGMTPVTQPQCVYVHDEGNEGLTGSINLSTSHIAFHIWDKRNFMMLDVYSCKSFDHKVVLKTLQTYFDGLEIDYVIMFDRTSGTLIEV